jgi:hypothetical protein
VEQVQTNFARELLEPLQHSSQEEETTVLLDFNRDLRKESHDETQTAAAQLFVFNLVGFWYFDFKGLLFFLLEIASVIVKKLSVSARQFAQSK